MAGVLYSKDFPASTSSTQVNLQQRLCSAFVFWCLLHPAELIHVRYVCRQGSAPECSNHQPQAGLPAVEARKKGSLIDVFLEEAISLVREKREYQKQREDRLEEEREIQQRREMRALELETTIIKERTYAMIFVIVLALCLIIYKALQ